MILTEEQALTKWCPFVRFHGTPSDDCIPNKPTVEDNPDQMRCIASACMAWRKDENSEYDPSGNLRGYCGLAGKP